MGLGFGLGLGVGLELGLGLGLGLGLRFGLRVAQLLEVLPWEGRRPVEGEEDLEGVGVGVCADP